MRKKAEILLFLAVVSAFVGCRSTAMPPPPKKVPDPLGAPPGASPLADAEARAARQAVLAAERGDPARARELAGRVPAGHPVRALVDVELRFLSGEAVFLPALELARDHPDWAGAWTLAALAGRQAGDLSGALAAARRASELDGGAQAGELVGDLERALASAAVRDARTRLGGGDAAGALAVAEAALESVPGSSDVRMMAATAALAAGRLDRAAALVPALPDTPSGLDLKGRVAEALGQWDLAVEFFAKLPADYPGRCGLVEQARIKLRLANAPPYVSRALASDALTRRQLAALVMWEVPALAEHARGPVPVFEDIVDAPERGDIVSVARSGVLAGDPVARRFGVGRPVTPREVAAVIDRVAAVLGKPAPAWCGDGVGIGRGEAGCLKPPSRATGMEAAELLRAVAGEEGGGCR